MIQHRHCLQQETTQAQWRRGGHKQKHRNGLDWVEGFAEKSTFTGQSPAWNPKSGCIGRREGLTVAVAEHLPIRVRQVQLLPIAPLSSHGYKYPLSSEDLPLTTMTLALPSASPWPSLITSPPSLTHHSKYYLQDSLTTFLASAVCHGPFCMLITWFAFPQVESQLFRVHRCESRWLG